ncbi:response regulator [Chitinophagaceae bacterium MMS25-I14]
MNVVLVDDHTLFLETLKGALEKDPGIRSVTCFSSGTAFQDAGIRDIDLLICDLIMDGMNGLKVIEYCRKSLDNEIKIIILSSLTDPQTIRHSMRLGVNGYLAKNTSVEELMDAIHMVMRGERYVGASLREKLINNMFVEEQEVYHLSPRERDVLQGICRGLTMKEIGFELGISAHTAQSYHRTVMKKLKISRAADLIIYAINNGLYIPPVSQ